MLWGPFYPGKVYILALSCHFWVHCISFILFRCVLCTVQSNCFKLWEISKLTYSNCILYTINASLKANRKSFMRCAEYVGIADDFDRHFNHPKQPEFSRRFLPRDAMLCVCLSRVGVLQKRAKYRITQTTLHDSSGNLWRQRCPRNSNGRLMQMRDVS